MIVLATLLALGFLTWVYRITFTVLVAAERLPAAVRSRMDVVGTAAFAALLASELAGTTHAALPGTAAAVVAAAITARLTRSHVASVGVAVVVWLFASAW